LLTPRTSARKPSRPREAWLHGVEFELERVGKHGLGGAKVTEQTLLLHVGLDQRDAIRVVRAEHDTREVLQVHLIANPDVGRHTRKRANARSSSFDAATEPKNKPEPERTSESSY
jgi:hypothetical protein